MVRIWLVSCLVFFSNAAFAVLAEADAEASAVAEAEPRLIVLIAVDQLRRDRVDEKLPGGIGKFSRLGRNYVESNLDHGVTTTCPGHSVMLTGVNPGKAGIAGNTYIDRASFSTRYCVEDDNPEHSVLGVDEGRSPLNLKFNTLGDWLHAASPESKVFSVSGKDRAAITIGGHHPDGAFWYHKALGKFTTSGYYAKSLPAYVEAFNGEDPLVDGHLKDLPVTWDHPTGQYRADDYEGEAEDNLRVSGHAVKKGDVEDIYMQVYGTPYVDRQTLRLAERIVAEEELGQRGTTDLLAVSLSATDVVGHQFGPKSAEAEDALKKMDLWLGDFMDKVEQQTDGKVLFVLTADHGVAELPEYMTNENRNQCPEQGRISVNGFIAKLYWNIYKEFTLPFDRPDNLVKFSGGAFTINPTFAEENDLDVNEVAEWLTNYLRGLDIVEQAWTRAELQNDKSEIARLMRNSMTVDKSGDVVLQLAKDCILKPDAGTTHGSVYDYDRDVPVVFYGWQVTPGKIKGEAHSVDIAPTIADHIGLPIPANLDGKPLPLR